MSRLRTRMLAAGTALLVAAAVALPATAPAFATAGPTFDAHGNKDYADVGDPNVYFLVELDGLPSSCVETRPVVSYTLSVVSPNGPVPATQGTMDTYSDQGTPYYEVWLPLENFSAGEVYTLDASTSDACFGDGQTFSDSATITINGGDVPEEPGDGGDDYPWDEYEGDGTARGTVYVQNVANSTSPADWAPRTGVEVGLFDVERTGDGPVDTDITDPSGDFELTAPYGDPGDEDIVYVIAANVDDEPYFFESDRDTSRPSPTDPDEADPMYVYEFDGESLDIYAGTLPEPAWSIAAPALTVGVAYDQTFTAPSTAPWNWGWGGDIEIDDDGLPAGIELEVIDGWNEDAVPALRVYGTPTEAGPYSFWVYLEDDYDHWVEFEVSGTVAPAGSGSGGSSGSGGAGEETGSNDPTSTAEPRDLDLDLKLEVGQPISGAEATASASGLKEGAGYDIIVRSTPQTLAVGTVPAGGAVTRTVTLPTLEAGWHSLTFTSTWAAGTGAVARLWFQVSAAGTLLAISDRAPNLANTGSNIGGTVLLSSFALLAGFGMMALRRRRSATV